MKCPKCGKETDKLYIFEPAYLVGILTNSGEQPPKNVQVEDKPEREYTCPNCLKTVTSDESKAYKMIGASPEKVWSWSYRDGEITGTVRANNWEEAVDKVIQDPAHWNLHEDMFEVSEYAEDSDDSAS